MKQLLFLFALLAGFNCFAQKDYCKKISFDKDEMKDYAYCYSPSFGGDVIMRVYKIFSEGHSFYQMDISTFGLHSDYGAKGVYMKFSDSTIIKIKDADVDCKYISQANYKSTSTVILNDDQVDAISTKTLTKVMVGNYKKDVEDYVAEKLREFFKCVMKCQKTG